MTRNYYQVRDWLEGFTPLVWGKEELGLARIEHLLKLLGNPEKKFKSVHVAGTSGKGSTSFYAARLLQKSGFKQSLRSSASPAGLKVGLHTSPHLIDIRERMVINGQMIPIRKFIRLIGGIRSIVEEIKKKTPDLTPSYFEILVAASFVHFAQEKVDFAVIEVGLGGRLDATNVLMPEVSVITNIGLDHTEILGDTVEKIATEKAGIIKVGVPVVTGAKGAALRVIKGVAKGKGSKLYKINTQQNSANGNKELALKVLKILKISTDKTSVKKVFDMAFPGRFEEIEKGVILDGAHNPDKIKFLIKSLSIKGGITLVIAFKKGKDWKKMVDLLLKNLPVKQVIATKFYAVTDMGKYQALEPEEIRDYVAKVHSAKCTVISNSQEAVFEVLQTTDYKLPTTVIVTGSLYLVGEVRTMWNLPQF